GLGAGTYSVTITDNNGCTFTITNITLNNPAPIVINAGVTQNVSCHGGSDGIISVASVTGGQGAPYTVSLTGPITSSYSGSAGTFTGLTAGNYTITVTDANNCTQTVNLTITQPDPINISTVATDVSCNGLSDGQINAAATGGNGSYSYTLMPGGITNLTGIFSGLTAGVYTVTVTDSKNCTATINVTVNEPAPLIATGGRATTKCHSTADAFIQIGVTGGNPGGYTYVLNPGGITNTTGFFDNLGAGTYIVTVTDSKGCSDTALVIITSPPPVEPTTLVRATVIATDAVNGKVLIEWNPSVSVNVKEYVVDWLNPATSTWIPIDTVNGLSTIHTLNTTTNPNVYRVSVVDICDNRTAPSPEHHTVFLTASVAGLDKQVQLNWTNYVGWTNVTAYKLYRRDVTNGGPNVLVATLNTNSYLDTDVRCKIVYEYVVEAIGDATSMSNTVKITPQDIVMPNTVEIKTATVENNRDIRIIWKANNSPDAYQYLLYRIMSGTTTPKLIAKLPLSDTTYLDKDVRVQDHSYTYYIMVEDSCGGLSNSSNIGRSILLNGTIGQGMSFSNVLNWNPYASWANGVKEYEVWRFTTLLPTPVMLNTTLNTNYEDDISSFTDENVFYYYVVAREQDGNNAISVSNVRAIVQPPRFYVPTAFTPGGANPTFNITGVFIKSYVLRVFDRWGNQIFETNSFNKSWDGGDYPQGVYAYTLRVIGMDDKIYDKAGTVTLLR
ncbi:MAG: gliding motility-associated C-terminal domain-containing protein, partial [Bacteroidia bacterium]|nr:gliding motility-associated C-terminal domain-containing protein [Bacteroidia bacterium]